MADFNEQQIKFGWLTLEEMTTAIAEGNLDAHDVCFTKDSHEVYLISKDLEPISIKSRVRIYATVESAIADINTTSQTYEGEILSIRDGDKFIAYVVNKFEDGDYYVTPVYSDTQIDYDGLQNTPITNLNGTLENPIVLADLDDGWYKVSGHFSTPDGKSFNSIVGNYIIVEQTDVSTKVIKRINTKNIIDYTIDNGVVSKDKYATEKFIEDKGYATTDYVDSSIAALQVTMEDYIQNYVATTCTLLIKHMISEELDQRYADNSDITDLFNN